MSGCRSSDARGYDLNIALAIFPSEAARYRTFLADFEQQHHVQVKIIAQGYGDILQAMKVRGRGSLDLCELDLAMLGEARADARNIDDFVSPTARELFSAQAWQAATFDGHIFFAPHRLMWQAMIYNRVEVPNPPATWEELGRFVREHPGKFALKGARYEGAVCDAAPFVWAAGGDLCAPGSAGSLRALSFLHSLAPDLNEETGVFREMSVLEAQARGSVWIHFNWPFAIDYLHDKGLAPEIDLSAPIPAGPAGRATPLGGGYLAIAASAPHPELAREFLKYLLTAQAQARLSKTLGWYGSVPPMPGSAEAKLYSGFVAMRPYVRARPASSCYPELSDRWRRAIRAAIDDYHASDKALADPFPEYTSHPATRSPVDACACTEAAR